MKGLSKVLIMVLLSMSLAFFVTGCSDNSSESSKKNTDVTTTDQGAQASNGAVNTVNSINSMGVDLSGTVGDGTGNGSDHMPKVKLPGGDSRIGMPVRNFTKRVSPVLKKARAMKAMKKAPVSSDCTYGGTVEYGWNDDGTVFTETYSMCKEVWGGSYWLTHGTFSFSMNADATSLSMTVNWTDTLYPDSTFASGTEEWKSTYDNYSLSYSGVASDNTSTWAFTGSYTMGGSWTGEDYVNDKKYQGINGLTMDASFAYTEVVPNSQYNYTSEYTMNGSISYKAFDTSTGAGTLEWQEAYSFSNLTTKVTWDETWDSVTYEWDAVYSYSIDGTFGIDLYPDNACFEGQFKFETVEPIELTYTVTYDSTTDEYTYNYSYTGGHIIINDVVDVVYNSDGSVTVTVNGEETTYQDNTLDGMCTELSSGESDGTQQGGTGPSSQQ